MAYPTVNDDHLIDPPGLGSVDDRCPHFYGPDDRCPFCEERPPMETRILTREARIERHRENELRDSRMAMNISDDTKRLFDDRANSSSAALFLRSLRGPWVRQATAEALEVGRRVGMAQLCREHDDLCPAGDDSRDATKVYGPMFEDAIKAALMTYLGRLSGAGRPMAEDEIVRLERDADETGEPS